MPSAVRYCILVLISSVLNKKQANTTTVTCVSLDDEESSYDTSNMSKADILRACFGGKSISLQGETTFVASGLEEVPAATLLTVDEVEMCILLENTGLTSIYCILKSIRGSCEGPKLTMVNNPHLEKLIMEPELFESLSSVKHAIRIRGNKKLDESSISQLKEHANGSECLDLQEIGECSLPRPFKSFQALDRDCSLFYGPLTLEQGVTEILYNSSEIYEFKLEGCVQIESTELKDLTFLYAFSRFKPIPGCAQFVRNNKKLCNSNLNYLNEFFKNINFYNNSEEVCGECIGGSVSERYLDESANCSSVYGDLIIANLRGIPSNIANLRGIESIEGRLVITNNTGLNIFEHLHSLKKIGPQNGKEVAVILKDNADLKILWMPGLSNINLKKDEKRVQLVNNPLLRLGGEKTVAELSTTEPTTAVFVSITIGNSKQRMQTSSEGAVTSKAYVFGIIAALLLSSSCTPGNFMGVKKKKCQRYWPRHQEFLRLLSQRQPVSVRTRTQDISTA